MSEERECTNFASAEDVLVWLSGFGGGPNQPSVEKVRDAIKFARAAIADEREVRQWAERQRDVAERGLADAHDVLATLRTERDEARAQLDALRVAAERVALRYVEATGQLRDFYNRLSQFAARKSDRENAGSVYAVCLRRHSDALEAVAPLSAILADTAGAAQERAAADARAVERIRARGEVEGDHCYPGQPAREAAWADRALESEARQAVHDAVALTNAEEERTRMDRHALVLAYEWLRSSSGRFTRESYKKYLESDSVYRVEMAMDALALGHSFCDGLRDVLTDRRGYVLRPARRTRARLALAIRAILRADRGDCGRARCSGCRCVTRNNAAIVRGWCSCCEERAEWRRDRITPLWERAGRTA